MKTRIQVLSVEHKSGRAKSGNDYSMDVAQCVVYDVDTKTAEEKILVGELVLPKGHAAVTAGFYEGEFGIAVGQDKRIGGRLIQLFPIKTPTAPLVQKP